MSESDSKIKREAMAGAASKRISPGGKKETVAACPSASSTVQQSLLTAATSHPRYTSN